ncbi:MAG: sigma-70 family RNA polymerase sigma factor [Endomicrobium sp.]|nr:sigma-70 family RNA polymerase sigma factor [Endomicrobium sp.]
MKRYSEEDLNSFPRKNFQKRNDEAVLTAKDLKDYGAFAVKAAQKYKIIFPSLDIEELIEEGKTGLLEASLRYRSDKKASFSTYAWFWIIKNIQNYISKNIGLISMPEKEKRLFISIKKLIEEKAKKGKTADIAQIAKAFDIDSSKVSDIISSGGAALNYLSLDKESDSLYGDSQNFSKNIEDKSQKDALSSLIDSDRTELFSSIFAKLSDKEQTVLSLRFCLDGVRAKKTSLKEISQKMDISVSKVKDLEQNALLKLKTMVKEINE